jgi:hypothetical protein
MRGYGLARKEGCGCGMGVEAINFKGVSGTQDSARDSQEPPFLGKYSSDIPFPTILNGSQWSIDDSSLQKLQVLIS